MVEENIGLEAITDSKIVDLKRVSRFTDDILSGKIKNKYDAEKVYIKIMEAENLLRNYKSFSSTKNAQTIAAVINNPRYAVFGPLLPSKDNADDIENVDIRDIPDLESEEDGKKKTKKIWIKNSDTIKINNTRLPILLAQKQAGNNNQKLNNEIRQIIYSLYRSKNLSKTLYNHLFKSIYKDE